MKIFLGLGWVFLVLFLTSGYFFKKLSIDSEKLAFDPIPWESHKQMFNGVVQCNLIGEELTLRKEILKKDIFSKVEKRVESPNGIVFYFNDEPDLLESVLEHMMLEKLCCPFFKFDVSILPFNEGFALQISGSEDAVEMMKEFSVPLID